MVGRFTDMEIRKLGRTNLQVSAIGFGSARLDEYPEQAVATVHRALDYGVNFIDTARDYGHSEKYLGQALQGRRSELVLATKVAFNRADFVQESVETSLAQLRVDDVDLIYAHGCNNAEHYRILMREQGMLHKLERVRSEGLTQFIGVSFDHFRRCVSGVRILGCSPGDYLPKNVRGVATIPLQYRPARRASGQGVGLPPV